MNIKQINQCLHSNDEKKIGQALYEITENGDSSVLLPLANLLMTDLDKKKYYKDIISIFSSLKDSKSVSVMMDIVNNSDYLSVRQILLSCIWNTTLDYSDYFADFVRIACWGTLLESVDCLTILENLQGEPQEQHLLDAQLYLKEYFDHQNNINAKEDEQKKQILSEIAFFIKIADRSIQG